MTDYSALRYANAPVDGLQVLSCRTEHHFGNHLHDGYVLWLNSESGEHYSYKGSSYTLQPGSISVIEPGVVHANYPAESSSRHLRSFYCSEEFLSSTVMKITGKEKRNIFRTREIQDLKIWLRLTYLHNMLLLSKDNLAIECAIITTFQELLNRLQNVSPKTPAEDSEIRLLRVEEYLRANLHTNICLDSLARLAGCSSFHLIRLFRLKKGITPHAFLVQLRLECARKLLHSGKSIADAAFLSGFADQSHLTRVFKLRFGITPGVYAAQSTL